MGFPLTDLFMRALLRLNLMNEDSSRDAYQQNLLLMRLAAWRIPIPRYYTCYAVVRKAR